MCVDSMLSESEGLGECKGSLCVLSLNDVRLWLRSGMHQQHHSLQFCRLLSF